MMRIQGIAVKDFTVFDEAIIRFCPGINVLIGENGTGKTHIMKLLYSACMTATGDEKSTFLRNLRDVFPDKIFAYRSFIRNFPLEEEYELPSCWIYAEDEHGRGAKLDCWQIRGGNDCITIGTDEWKSALHGVCDAVFIPQDILLEYGDCEIVDTSGMYSWDKTELLHEELMKQCMVEEKSPDDIRFNRELLMRMDEITHGEFFKYRSRHMSTGILKISVLQRLIQNGTLKNWSILFWENPDANLSPRMTSLVASVLLELQRIGVQVFLTTHDYFLPKYLELRRVKDDKIRYHSFYAPDNGAAQVNSSDEYKLLCHNHIMGAFVDLFREETEHDIGGV